MKKNTHCQLLASTYLSKKTIAWAMVMMLMLAHPMGKLRAQSAQHFNIMCWNVENLFNPSKAQNRNDAAFTPEGENHWTYERLDKKLNDIGKVILSASLSGSATSHSELPALVGLCEVEDSAVLNRLCKNTVLRKFDYGYVHFESPDSRGIDCALLYRKAQLRLLEARPVSVSDRRNGFRTRHILTATFCTNANDTMIIMVCHLPSKLGGSESYTRRKKVATKLHALMCEQQHLHPTALVLAMGDMNDTPSSDALRGLTMAHADSLGTKTISLMANLRGNEGSYKYKGKWEYIDQFIVATNSRTANSASLRIDPNSVGTVISWAQMEPDKSYGGNKPRRTYLGTTYNGGISDHLPIRVSVHKNK